MSQDNKDWIKQWMEENPKLKEIYDIECYFHDAINHCEDSETQDVGTCLAQVIIRFHNVLEDYRRTYPSLNFIEADYKAPNQVDEDADLPNKFQEFKMKVEEQ